jgi:hypothetical protein
MSPSTLTAKVSAKQAQRLLEAEQAVRRHRSELEAAEDRLGDLRAKCRSRVPLSRDPEERKKRIRYIEVAGVKIRVTPALGGDSFSLKRYSEAGHKITPQMQEAIRPGRAYDRWTIKALGA